MNMLLAILSLVLFLGLQGLAEGSTAEQRRNVVNFLRNKSPPLVRPDGEGGADTPVVVHIKYSHIRILDVDDEDCTIKTSGFLILTWTDRRLGYQRMMSYRGDRLNVASVRLDADSIWTPDIELYEAGSKGMRSVLRKEQAVVMPPGNMTWIPYIAATTFCDLESGNHTMACHIRLGSWTYSSDDMDLQVAEEVLMTGHWTQGPWRLRSSSAHREVKQFLCCPLSYITIVYTFNFERS